MTPQANTTTLHRADIERAIIGTLLLNRDYFYQVGGRINEKHFSDGPCASLFTAIGDAYGKCERIDFNLFAKSTGLPLSELKAFTDHTAPGNLDEYVELLLTEHKRDTLRGHLNAAQMQLDHAAPDTVITGLDDAFNAIIADQQSDHRDGHVSTAVREGLGAIHAAHEAKGLSGIDTGFASLNEMTGGFQASDQIILAARPGMGKTTLACNFLLTAATHDVPCVFYSLEMSKSQVVQLLASIITGISTEKMRAGNLSDKEINQIQQAFDSIYQKPLFIYDDRYRISDILSTTRFLKRKYGIRLVFIDYLQLIDAGLPRQNRTSQIEYVSRKLKLMASKGDCDLCNIILSQLNRSVEQRTDKRPMLSDLRDSGAIEQDADMVTLLYRGSYYAHDSDDHTTELIVAKNRHGRICAHYLGYKHRRFSEIEKPLI